MGFLKILSKCSPETAHPPTLLSGAQNPNVLDVLSKSMQPKVKTALHEIGMAEIRADAEKAIKRCLVRFEAKSPGAMKCLSRTGKGCWRSMASRLNTGCIFGATNRIESTFLTARLAGPERPRWR